MRRRPPLGGGEDRCGGALRVGGREGAARGALRVVLGADRVELGADRGGLTVRDGVVDRGGVTLRVGARRSREPDEGLVVRPEPTVPCALRDGTSVTRRGSTCRTPVGLAVVGFTRRSPTPLCP